MPSTTTRGSGMDERRDAGRAARVRVPRRALGEWDASRRTHDALEVVVAQSHDRVPELVPIRHGRMAATPWTHYRGAAAVMAADLATAEHSALEVQLCGDAHILNFGLWATPERNLSYDLRDFDETLPGPFEWDVQRLAASLEVLAREVGLPDGAGAEAAVAMGEAYRLAMRRAASMGELEIWYDQVPLDRFVDFFVPEEREDIVRDISVEARRRTSRGAARKLVRVVDGAPRIVEDPPFRVRVDDPDERAGDAAIVDAYRATLPEYRRHLLDRFTVGGRGPAGGGRRQRGHAGLPRPVRGPQRRRPPLPAVQAGRALGVRGPSRSERTPQPRPAGRRGPPADAERRRHLHRLDPRRRRGRLRAPVPRHEGDPRS